MSMVEAHTRGEHVLVRAEGCPTCKAAAERIERLVTECARHKRNAECYAAEAGDPTMDGVEDTKLARAEAERERLVARVKDLEKALEWEAFEDCSCHCCEQKIRRAKLVLGMDARVDAALVHAK